MSRFCRHNRLLVDCPICSKGTVLGTARSPDGRSRSRTSGGTRKSSSRGGHVTTTVRGPYAAAGPYEGGREIRMERVPGGLRVAEWHAGQISRKAPVLDAAHLPRLLAEAAGKDLLSEVDTTGEGAHGNGNPYGTSPGRAGEFQEELRVERVEGDRVRIARWIMRPNAGWQLQEAPVMLPAERFEQALESAAARGVLVPLGAEVS